MSALGDLIDALRAAVEAYEQAAAAVRSADDEADTALNLAEEAGLRSGVDVLVAGKDDLGQLVGQLSAGEAVLEELMGRVQAVIDGT